MIENYLKVAIRSISRGKWYSVMNVFSLTIGLTVAILAYLFIQHEYSYDKFNKEIGNIYRFTHIERLHDQDRYREGAMYPMAEVLKDEFPSIDLVARINHHADYRGLPLMSYADRQFLEKQFYWGDKELFELFTFRFLEGSPETALKDLRSLVISKKIAEKYFGDEPAIGKELTLKVDLDPVKNGRQAEDYTMVVSGVVDIPETSSIQFDVMANILFSTMERGASKTNWYYSNYSTYVKLIEGAQVASLQAELPGFVQKYADKEIRDQIAFHLQPLSSVHLDSLPGDKRTSASQQTLNMVNIIALAILILACINFTNLSTARFTKRAKEVGVRKVVGADKRQLVFQFLLESMLFSFLAMIGAILMALMILPLFNQLIGASLSLNLWGLGLWLPLLFMTMLVGLFAGVYPAFILSSFEAISVLKGHFTSGFKGTMIRKILVVSQFTATIVLLIGVTVISLQTSYLKNANLEIKRDQYAMIRLKEEVYTQQEQYQSFKNELLKDATVESVAGTWSAPFGVNVPVFNYPFKTEGFSESDRIHMHLIRADEDFIDAFDINLIKGRKLSTEFPNDNTSAFVINQSAAELMGFDDPVGKTLEVFSGNGSSFKTGKVVGVMEDFNFLSLHNEIGPLVISMTNSNQYRYMTVRFNPEGTAGMLKHVESAWAKFEPGWPLEMFFMDEEWEIHYESETRLGNIVQYLTVIAVLIACLGLFALSGFSFEKRKKEVSIRKVLGASVKSIYQLLSFDFVKLVLLSLVISAPVGWILAVNWLDGFAYRIDMEWWIIGLIALAMMLITILTVSYHALKSGRLNPVENLKSV